MFGFRSKLKKDTPKEKLLKHGFRFRGVDNTRIEALSDGVFAIAIALLLISTDSPKTYDELRSFMSDIVPFGATIALLMIIWYQHYLFFIRYGLKDAATVAVNTLLLFTILFYVYPLRFLFKVLYTLFTGLFTGNEQKLEHLFSVTLQMRDAPSLMVIYGLGGASIFAIMSWLYFIALKRKESLELTDEEVFETRSSIYANLLQAAIPALSALVAFSGIFGKHTFSMAGFTYWLYPAVMFPFAAIRSKAKKKLFKDES